jgi:Zn-dependent peptidase ImmA (M78 family)/DNA-binding XRE family transcriptional regulator
MPTPLDSWQEVGRKLARARKSARLSQADLAAVLQLDRTAVTKAEAGERRIDSLELARVADLLKRPIDWFLHESPPAVVSRRQTRDMEDESQADILLESLAADVELMIELRLLVPPPDVRPTAPVETAEDAERAAFELRRHVETESGPLWDLQGIVERVGLYAFSIELDDEGLDGSYLALQAGGAALINGRAHSGRRRFTLAHELGHHVFADQYSGEWILGADGDERERLINIFAVNFLMPREPVIRRWRELQGDQRMRDAAIALAAEYGVSWTAVCSHLRNLRLIDEGIRSSLELERPRKADYLEAGIVVRKDLAPPAVPPKFAAAVVKGFRNHKLSDARAVSLLRGTAMEDDLPEQATVPLEAMRVEMELD